MIFAVVSHDAGGAELVSSYIRRAGLKTQFVLDGPAVAVFERKLGSIDSVGLEQALAISDTILCATSWQSDLEFNALKRARELHKPTIAFLDHWTNYRERFERRGEQCLPDELWVADSYALGIAQREFRTTKIRCVGNPYLDDIEGQLRSLTPNRLAGPALSVLYVAEPIREHAQLRFGDERHWGFVEEEAVRYLLQHLNVLGPNIGAVKIRPHPSEPRAKYDWTKQECRVPVSIGGQASLVDEIAAADIIVGCESIALVVGLIAGKHVVSCIPPGGKACSLPHSEIRSLADLIRDHDRYYQTNP